jgi:putative tryptophan/tyrosine transport system substrate-binding protein
MIGRRRFITLLGGAAAVWPLAARAQQPAVPVIGYLGTGSPDQFAYLVRAFHLGLSETGYVEGLNVAIEYRWAGDQYDRFPALAADLVRRRVDVIVAAGGNSSAPAAKAATSTIPIVFNMGADPVDAGLVASLNRPGGNLTGVMTLNTELGPKRLELLHEAVPGAAIIALLLNPANPNAKPLSSSLQTSAGTLGLQLQVLYASTERDLDPAFATLPQLRAGALLIGTDPVFTSQSGQLAALTIHYAVPTIYTYSEFAAAGGLMSYGTSLTDVQRQIGVYAGRILKGEKPADLPVQQVTKIELVINLKTAKMLGLTIPLPLLGRADEVIE